MYGKEIMLIEIYYGVKIKDEPKNETINQEN
jgi:hypothetical protein